MKRRYTDCVASARRRERMNDVEPRILCAENFEKVTEIVFLTLTDESI